MATSDWRHSPSVVLWLALAYYAAGRLGLLLALPPGYATAVWPPSGLALAGVLLGGRRVWPGIVLGSFFINVGTSFDASTSVLLLRSLALALNIGLGAAAQALVGAWLIQRAVADAAGFAREEDAIRFLVIGGPVGCCVSATIGVASLVFCGLLSPSDIAYTWCTWWIGDSIGCMLFAPLVLVWAAPSPAMSRRRRLSVSLPIAFAFALAVMLFVYVSRLEQARIKAAFERRANDLTQVLRSNLEGDVEALHATERLFTSSVDVERHEFRTFTERLLERHRDMLAISWDPRVEASERSRFASATSARGAGIQQLNAAGDLVTAAERPEYFPIHFIEPLEANRGVLGFDVASDSSRRAALERARDTASPVAASGLRLVQGGGDPTGMVVFLPVYSADHVPATLAERRSQLRGFVAGVFRVGRMVDVPLAAARREDIDMDLYEIAASAPDRLVYSSARGAGSGVALTPAFAHSVSLGIGGQQWRLVFSLPRARLLAQRSLQSWTLLASALVFTALFGAFLLVLTGRTALVEGLVAERTAALAEEIAERKRAAEALRRVERIRHDMVAMLSHDIKNPLSAVLGFSSILRESPADDPDRDLLFDRIEASTEAALALAVNFVDVSQIESGALVPTFEPTRLNDVVERVLSYQQSRARVQGVELRTDLDRALPSAQFDRRLIERVVANLVSNAVKFWLSCTSCG